MAAQATHPSPRLNLDILREIALYADRATCMALIQCCRYLYHEAAKATLSKCVPLRKDERIIKFLEFLSADNGSRFRYVRDLCLDFKYGTTNDTVDSFVDSMSRMARLERLQLCVGDTLLKNYPMLADAIAKATCLRHLNISYCVGRLTFALLQSMQSHLISIRLNWRGFDGVYVDSVSPDHLSEYHPVPLLAKWASTLEELGCQAWRTGLDVPAFTQVYPKLRLLEITGGDFPLVAPYIRAFPNLKQIYYAMDDRDDWDDPCKTDLEGFRAHRKLNIRAQLAPDGPGTWQNLQQFSGMLIHLYLIGHTGRISSIKFSSCIEARHLDMLGSVLSYAQPRHHCEVNWGSKYPPAGTISGNHPRWG